MVLTAHTIKAAIEDGVDEYRFLRGGEQYKYRFATHDLGLVTVSRPRSLAGKVVIAAAALGGRTRIRSILRRKLRPA
jgi:CelD/BcsL family acetyltransferase involved in cellulose biosynthesis